MSDDNGKTTKAKRGGSRKSADPGEVIANCIASLNSLRPAARARARKAIDAYFSDEQSIVDEVFGQDGTDDKTEQPSA